MKVNKIIILFLLIIILTMCCGLTSASKTKIYILNDDGWITNEFGYKIIHDDLVNKWSLSNNRALVNMSRVWQNIIDNIDDDQNEENKEIFYWKNYMKKYDKISRYKITINALSIDSKTYHMVN